MEKAKKIKIILGIIYFLILFIFLWSFFSFFSMNEISTYEFIKKNRNLLLDFKENNFLLTTIIFFILNNMGKIFATKNGGTPPTNL